jgi:hypothetical protein
MQMAVELIMGLNAFKTMFDIAKGLQNIHDTAARDRAVIDLQREILAAQADQSTLIETVGKLEKEVAALKAWDADKQRYKLTELKTGVLAYALRDGMENGEPPHHLCTSCYQSGLKSILVAATWNPGRCHVLICNDCGWYAYLQGMADPQHKDQRPKPYRGS